LLEPGAFRSLADRAIGRLVLPLQEPHRWFFDPGRPRQSVRLLPFLQPRARFASYVYTSGNATVWLSSGEGRRPAEPMAVQVLALTFMAAERRLPA
jgi:hypothetical protein